MTKCLVIPAAMLFAATASAVPAEPTGEWVVEKGVARIKIDNCGGSLWGVISWEQRPGGRDENNPDPAKRARPILGMPILIDMKPASGNKWEGEVYNAENGKRYASSISLKGSDTLRIQGCVLGFLCGGENWTRFSDPADPPSSPPMPPSRGRAADPSKAKTVDVCSIVGRAGGTSTGSSRTTGSAHERRLK